MYYRLEKGPATLPHGQQKESEKPPDCVLKQITNFHPSYLPLKVSWSGNR